MKDQTEDQSQNLEIRGNLQNFTKILNANPKTKEIQVNTMANNSKYLPISFVEMDLDEVFFGLWQTENFKTQVVMNEIIGQLELVVFHPVAKQWIRRTGAASVMIQLSKDSKITEIDKKIKNTLVKDFPHLKAECLKNAARSWGKRFGRDLNRKLEDTYQPLLNIPAKKLPELEAGTEDYYNVQTGLNNGMTMDQAKKKFNISEELEKQLTL